MDKYNKRQKWMHEYAAAVLSRYSILAGSIDWHKADMFYDTGYTPRGALVGMAPDDIKLTLTYYYNPRIG